MKMRKRTYYRKTGNGKKEGKGNRRKEKKRKINIIAHCRKKQIGKK